MKKASIEIIGAGIRLIQEGLSDGTNGNISVRSAGGDEFLITPSARDYRRLASRDLVRINLVDGRITGRLAPSSESELHARIYRARRDVGAIVHHHATFATAVAVARRTIPVLVDEASDIGPIHTAPYAVSASTDLAVVVAAHLTAENNAVLIANHGAVVVGSNLKEAVRRAIAVERIAKIYIAAELLGGACPLDADAIAANRTFFERYRGARRPVADRSATRELIGVRDLVGHGVDAATIFASLLRGFIVQRLRRVGV
jgi:L-fuculose-phosphate aldolase